MVWDVNVNIGTFEKFVCRNDNWSGVGFDKNGTLYVLFD